MQKRLVILGSTGSVGTQALEVIAAHPEQFTIVALVAFHNDKLLETQLDRFRPDLAVLIDPAAAARLKSRYHGPAKLLAGQEGLLAAATFAAADTVFNSLVGFAGLKPTLAAIDAGKNIALANKETLVAAGEIVTRAAKEKGVSIVPVDSEHSAILQSLQGERRANISQNHPHRVRRTLFRLDRQPAAAGLSGSLSAPSQLVDGQKDHRRFSHSGQQRAGSHRSQMAV